MNDFKNVNTKLLYKCLVNQLRIFKLKNNIIKSAVPLDKTKYSDLLSSLDKYIVTDKKIVSYIVNDAIDMYVFPDIWSYPGFTTSKAYFKSNLVRQIVRFTLIGMSFIKGKKIRDALTVMLTYELSLALYFVLRYRAKVIKPYDGASPAKIKVGKDVSIMVKNFFLDDLLKQDDKELLYASAVSYVIGHWNAMTYLSRYVLGFKPEVLFYMTKAVRNEEYLLLTLYLIVMLVISTLNVEFSTTSHKFAMKFVADCGFYEDFVRLRRSVSIRFGNNILLNVGNALRFQTKQDIVDNINNLLPKLFAIQNKLLKL